VISDNAYRDPQVARRYLDKLASLTAGLTTPITLMEVCGTHTMAIYQHGIRSLLPPAIRLVSGPGCPVCVTPLSYIDRAIALVRRPDTLIATFGDMVRVPGSSSSLIHEQATGGQVRIVYSTLDALVLARKNPDKKVIFLGVGFETTAPTIAGALIAARREGLNNFFVLCAHKTMPVPMAALTADPQLNIDGYLCPAHVSAIIGANAYRFLAEDRGIPCVVTGFEPLDILQGIDMAIAQILSGQARVDIQYCRFVKPEGNLKAQHLLKEVFEPCDAEWRGLGNIPASGLRLAPAFEAFDAEKALPVAVEPLREHTGCRCGEILKGQIAPRQCPLFRTVCTPENPVGACMVSSEGTCAAEYKYGD